MTKGERSKKEGKRESSATTIERTRKRRAGAGCILRKRERVRKGRGGQAVLPSRKKRTGIFPMSGGEKGRD